MKHSHVARSLKTIESDHVTFLEFLLSLTRHQMETAILIATPKKTYLQLKSNEDSEDWIIRQQLLSTVNFRFVLCILLCAIFQIKYTLSLK